MKHQPICNPSGALVTPLEAAMLRESKTSPGRWFSCRRSRLVIGLALMSLAWAAPLRAQTVDSVVTNRLAEPFNVAVEAGVFYITDSANDRIVRFVPDTGAFSTLAGFAGRPGSTDAKGVYARFYSPRGIVAAPGRGGLVVADYANHTLRLVNLDGTVTTLAGTAGTPGFEPGTTTARLAHFNFPSTLAIDAAGNIYIADSKNNAIRKLDPSDMITTVVSDLNVPGGIAVGDNGDLWVSESRNHTILRVAAGGGLELAAGFPGQSGATDSIFADESLFNNPTALLWLGGGPTACWFATRAITHFVASTPTRRLWATRWKRLRVFPRNPALRMDHCGRQNSTCPPA